MASSSSSVPHCWCNCTNILSLGRLKWWWSNISMIQLWFVNEIIWYNFFMLIITQLVNSPWFCPNLGLNSLKLLLLILMNNGVWILSMHFTLFVLISMFFLASTCVTSPVWSIVFVLLLFFHEVERILLLLENFLLIDTLKSIQGFVRFCILAL